jgi:beta-1,4-mannosyl-glycoprotein beta-1,4-N-acetylglucosaminyltransferase
MKRKIYVCFPFYNELEILKIKLEELYDVVDHFILVEADTTHNGNPKPLYFKENEALFEKYKDKIIYHLESDMPYNFNEIEISSNNDDATNFLIERVKKSDWFDKSVPSYCRDTWQKESVIKPLFDMKANNDDLVVLGDLDEIPSADALIQIVKDYDDDEIFHMEHRFCWYYLNLQKTDEVWYGNILTSFRRFKEIGFCEMRTYKKGNFINNAGWHFSYMKGAEAIKNKIENFGEQSLNVPQVKDNIANNIENCLTNGHDLFFRPAKFEIIPINYETMPKYVVDHQEEFKDMIKEAT